METMIVTIGATIVKMGVLGGMTAGIITGIKWFGKYDPRLKGKNASAVGGGDDESDPIEHLRKQARQRS